MYHLGKGLTVTSTALPVKGAFTKIETTPVIEQEIKEMRPVSEYTPDLDPEDQDADISQSIPRDPRLANDELGPAETVSPWDQEPAQEEFDLYFERELVGKRGMEVVRLSDFLPVIRKVGKSRGWGYNQLTRLDAQGVIKSDPQGTRNYRVVTRTGAVINGVPVS